MECHLILLCSLLPGQNSFDGVDRMWGSETEKKEYGALFPLFYGSQEERNYAKGIKAIKKLAAGGYVPAICELGIAYYDHLGVHRNYSESFRFYMEAALRDYPCLLYTSPSPRDGLLSRMPSSA